MGFVADLFFSLWRADLKISGFAVKFVGSVRMEAVSGKKKLQIKKYLDTCGRGLNVGFVFGLLEDRNRSPTL